MSPEQRLLMMNRIREHTKTDQQIALEVGIHSSSVGSNRRKLGIPSVNPVSVLSEETQQQIKTEFDALPNHSIKTVSALAGKFGVRS